MIQKIKILVTGGLGHVGSFFIELFNSENFDITVVDNFTTQRYCSLFNIKNKIKFLECNFVDLEEDILAKYDYVIHLAAITDASASFSDDQKKKIDEINVSDTKKLIQKCKSACIKKFIFPSSTSVYGISTTKVDEDMISAINPQSPYAESKIQIEEFIKNELKNTSTDYLILRWGTIFGTSKGMRFHTAINKFCYQAATGIPLTIWRQNYNQVRPYLGIYDAVNSIFYFLNKDSSYWNTTYNVVTENVTLETIIETIKECLSSLDQNKSIQLKMIDSPMLNQHSYNISNDKIITAGFKHVDNLRLTILNTLMMLSGISNN